MALTRAAAKHLNKKSLVVFSGQNLGFRSVNCLNYFSDLNGYNIMSDTVLRGVEGWDARLVSAIKNSLDGGGGVAVLSDLLGEPTQGGIGLSMKEYPKPSIGEISLLFREWKKIDSWRVDKYLFYEIEAPKGWSENL